MAVTLTNECTKLDDETTIMVIASSATGRREILIDTPLVKFVQSMGNWCWDNNKSLAYGVFMGKRIELHRHLLKANYGEGNLGNCNFIRSYDPMQTGPQQLDLRMSNFTVRQPYFRPRTGKLAQQHIDAYKDAPTAVLPMLETEPG